MAHNAAVLAQRLDQARLVAVQFAVGRKLIDLFHAQRVAGAVGRRKDVPERALPQRLQIVERHGAPLQLLHKRLRHVVQVVVHGALLGAPLGHGARFDALLAHKAERAQQQLQINRHVVSAGVGALSLGARRHLQVLLRLAVREACTFDQLAQARRQLGQLFHMHHRSRRVGAATIYAETANAREHAHADGHKTNNNSSGKKINQTDFFSAC